MNEHILLQIAKKIKQVRKLENLTVQEVANRAQVSKGLISKIENGRTIPSLPVLLSIIGGLETNAEDFFSGFNSMENQNVVTVLKKKEYQAFEKEEAKGFHYKHIMSRELEGLTIDCVLLNLKPNAEREQVITEAFEYKYVLSGAATYLIGEESYELEEGDSIFFDGRIPHVPKNLSSKDCTMLIIYFFNKEK